MALEFALPDIGEGLADATVLEWLVAVGDEVGMDEPLVSLETDKAVVDMPAPRAGVVLHHGAAAGDVLAVGELLVVIGEPEEEWRPAAEPGPASADAAPIVGTIASEAETLAPAGTVQALPRIRKLAAELGVDLGAVAGSGAGGRITEADVRAAAPADPLDGTDADRVPLSPTRRAIAEHLARSWREIPHVWTYGSADAAPLLAARKRHTDETGGPVPLEALLVRAVTPLLAEHQLFNATFGGDHVLQHRRYDVGFAVDGPEGLVVAVLRGADRLGVAELAAEVARLAAAVRDRSVRADELRGATFTVSNIGAVGGRYGTPIVPHGTTAILSVGRADEAPVVRDGQVVVAREFPLSLGYDHRVIDGAAGRRFLAAVVERLESPE